MRQGSDMVQNGAMTMGVAGARSASPPPSGTSVGEETKLLVQKAKAARLQTQVDSCKALEKQAFRLSELARESDLPFLVYLLDMARVAAVDERARLMRHISALNGRGA